MRLTNRCYCLTGLTYADYLSVNAGFITGDSETIIVDSGYNIEAAQTIEGYAKAAAPNNKITYIVNTDGHYDHVFGNGYFIKQGAKVIAHSKTAVSEQELLKHVAKCNKNINNDSRRSNREAFIYFDGIAPYKPNIAINEKLELSVDGLNLHIYPAMGHTVTNIIVYEKREKVLYSGDTLYSKYLPKLSLGNKVLWEKWIETLIFIEQLEPEVVVPGHGPVLHGKDIYTEIERHKKIILNRISELN
jgi:glyoxylase-like metal-dependent hydrolase (beta-lactamase superfamily II)